MIFLLGGARSGKSTLAVRIAGRVRLPVTFIATAEARDAEMKARILAHQAARPSQWQTIEAPTDLAGALQTSGQRAVVIDCLTLWVANLLEAGAEASEVEGAASRAAGIAARRRLLTVVVSNEVGLGLVPLAPLGRSYRDLLGRVNAIWAEAAATSLLVVAGRTVKLERCDWLAEGAGEIS